MEGLRFLLIPGGLALAVCFLLAGVSLREKKVFEGSFFMIAGIIVAFLAGSIVLAKFDKPNELKNGIYQKAARPVKKSPKSKDFGLFNALYSP